MHDDIQESYRSFLQKVAIPFNAITEAEDWHLRIFFLPSILPETIFDVDHRKGRILFYRSSLRSSAWSAINQTHREKGHVLHIVSERSCAELPIDHPFVRLVADEHIFRMVDTELSAVDADSYVVELTHASGTVEFECWSSAITQPWHRLLNALQDATSRLPKSK